MNFFSSHMKQRFFASLLIAIVLVSGISAADVYLFMRIRRASEILTTAKVAIRGLEAKRSSLILTRDRLRDFSSDVAILESAFVDASNPLSLIETLERAARSRGVLLKLSLPQKRQKTFSLRLDAEGRFSGLLLFVRALEELPFQAIIEDFSFEVLSREIVSQDSTSPAHFVGVIEVLAK